MEKYTTSDSPAYPAEVAPDTVCFLAVQAQAFSAKTPGPGDEAVDAADDDQALGVLGFVDDASDDLFIGTVEALSDEEQIDLVALAWVGRGDYEADDFEEARRTATAAYNRDSIASYLLGMPLLGVYLEDALSYYDETCQDYTQDRV